MIHLLLLSGVRPDLVSRLLLFKTLEEVPQYMKGSIMFPVDDSYSGFVVIAIGGPQRTRPDLYKTGKSPGSLSEAVL